MELTDELMTLILLKLPVKSLGRLKCVKKSWHSLISSPYFINLHRSSTNKNDCFLVSRYFFNRPSREQHVLSLHSYETLDDLGNQINLPFFLVGEVELCGSCDGLVCLSDYDDQIVISNPTIREFRSLYGFSSGKQINSIAFGYNPNTGQYTVVMIRVAIYGDREAWLYDFSTDSWRKTAAVMPPDPFCYSRRAISLNGAFSWGHDSNILTFHMSNEVTGFIPLPDFAQVTHNRELCISSQSQLSLVLYNYVGQFEISVMTEYGVKESWTRIVNIGPPLPNINGPMFLFFWDEQRLLLISSERQLVSCDHQHQNLRHFPIDGCFDLYPYSQCLVSVNGIRKSIV